MPLSPELARWLQLEGHDAVHAGQIGLHMAADKTIMERAKSEGRTIVTADLDYPQLLAMSNDAAPGVILFRDGNWSDAAVIVRMTELLAAVPQDQIEQSIITVERERIRRRPLPLG